MDRGDFSKPSLDFKQFFDGGFVGVPNVMPQEATRYHRSALPTRELPVKQEDEAKVIRHTAAVGHDHTVRGILYEMFPRKSPCRPNRDCPSLRSIPFPFLNPLFKVLDSYIFLLSL